MKRPVRPLLIDNVDSFVVNLAHRIGEITGELPPIAPNGAGVPGLNAEALIRAVIAHQPTHLVLSPGPGSPHDDARVGIGPRLVELLGGTTAILGVCLGHQTIGAVFGARVSKAPRPRHGKTSPIEHPGTGLFAGLPSPFTAMRYHSLAIERCTLPRELRETARSTDDDVIMGFEHIVLPIFGVQFHPESIGTPDGSGLLRNFLDASPGRRDLRELAGGGPRR